MADAAYLRSQAVRYLAMALQAHDQGDLSLADLLTRRAAQYIDDADAAGSVGQQQQQPQPKKQGD